MRPFVSACAVVAAYASLAWSPPIHAQDWLRLAIEPEARVHDFGTVARAANTEHRFVISNTLQADMHLRSVRASCGCTTPIIETEWIKPGESGTILARFNTGTFTGQKAATLTVSIDKPYFTELQLNVKGYIRSDVVLSPGEASFSQVPEGEAKQIELNLDYAGRNDWAIERIESPFEFLQADFKERSRGGGRVGYTLTIQLDSRAPAGMLHSQLVLHTNDRRLTTIPIRVLANVESAVQTSPQSFALGEVKLGETIQHRLVVKGREPFRILAITSDVAEIGFTPIEEKKPAHLLNITLTPKAQETDKVSGHVLLKTDLLDEPTRLELTYTVVTQSLSHPQPPDQVLTQSHAKPEPDLE